MSTPPEVFLNRPLPSNEACERAILGAVLIDNAHFAQVAETLTAEDFYHPLHRRVYTAMLGLFGDGRNIDPLLILEELKKQGDIDSLGGPSVITNFTFGLPMTLNLEDYVAVIRDNSARRRLLTACSDITREVFNDNTALANLMDLAEGRIYSVSNQEATSSVKSIQELVNTSITSSLAAAETDNRISGLCTGFSDLDMRISGLQRGELTIIAARPSMGKTALGLNIACNVAFRGQGVVVVFSLEMSEVQVTERVVCSELGLNSQRYRVGDLDDREREELTQLQGVISESRLFIDDTAAVGILHLRAKLRRLHQQHRQLDLVVVDYIQLMTGRTQESREREVAQISRDLKGLAKEFNVPVIAMSQLNRGAEQRANHIPNLADLRESGSIEQDADVVALIYRDDYYNPDLSSHSHIGQVIIAKNRNGPTGMVNLRFDAPTATFSTLVTNF